MGRQYELRCLACNTTFVASTQYRSYCSAECRKKGSQFLHGKVHRVTGSGVRRVRCGGGFRILRKPLTLGG